MEKGLQKINEAFIFRLKKEPGVLGAWYFGSASHGTTDPFSDIDIVFLLEPESFHILSEKRMELLQAVCDEVVICWPESFNGNAIKNYGCLLKQQGQLFLYDIFFLNSGAIDDSMCKIHYAGLKEQNVVFDKDGSVKKLISQAPQGSLWQGDMDEIITTYWFHVHMSAKYLLRKDFFKLNNVMRLLMDTHAALLLTVLDTTPWGGSANKLHFIACEKQKHLMRYGCEENYGKMQENILQSMCWFEKDVEEIGQPGQAALSRHLSLAIKNNWMRQTESI